MRHPARVSIVEVGARDGLQNETASVSTAVKLELIARLADAGLQRIEATAFVSPQRVPHMADQLAVMQGVQRRAGVRYSALTPNLKGFEAALAAGADEVAVFASASESFSRSNIQCSIAESLARFAPLMASARDAGIAVRGYLSCVLGCPYEGPISAERVRELSETLLDAGCYEVSLGDTIGTGTPGSTARLLDTLLGRIPADRIAGHFHDTYGQGLANVLTAMEFGIATFDTSVAGLGGCPYAAGASGNLATEDLVYLLDGLGIESGVRLGRLVSAAGFICAQLGREPAGRTARAMLAKQAAAQS